MGNHGAMRSWLDMVAAGDFEGAEICQRTTLSFTSQVGRIRTARPKTPPPSGRKEAGPESAFQ